MPISQFNVLGVAIGAVTPESAAAFVRQAARAGMRGYVCATSVHGVIEARRDPALRRILNRALLSVPDGMPLAWMGRLQGQRLARVYGPDLMPALCAQKDEEAGRPLRHFFLGATPDTLERLTRNLRARFPGLHVVGTHAPPFRPLTADEEDELIATLRSAQPDLIWVGLSTPKQERLMAPLAARLETGILLGVGAAFDLHAGLRRDTPSWIKRMGLQWLHRLCQEPRRLAGRYARIVPAFLFLAMLQILGLRRYPLEDNTPEPAGSSGEGS